MIFDLQKISTREFLTLDENAALPYWKLQSFMKPIAKFGRYDAKRLGEMAFGDVTSIKHAIQKPDYDSLIQIFNSVFGIKESQFLNAPVTDFLSALTWLRLSVSELIKKEYNALKTEPDQDMEAAGVHRLNIFNEMNTLIAIGQQYNKSPEEIETWKYNLVFALMLHNKIQSEVQKSYAEIKSKAK
tara:strand:- start:20035 stop:20592 length:558 start_codon:yes stop_codon:yes gene_type:complete